MGEVLNNQSSKYKASAHKRRQYSRLDYNEYCELKREYGSTKIIYQVISPLLCDVEETLHSKSSIRSAPISPPYNSDPGAPVDVEDLVEQQLADYYGRRW